MKIANQYVKCTLEHTNEQLNVEVSSEKCLQKVSCIPFLRDPYGEYSPFPPIGIIGAMMIFWRVRGKIIRSVLCNIGCNNCAQCNAHTYEQT